MEWYVRAFLKASLAWLAMGVTLGVAMAARPAWTIYRTAHVHMVMLGFVTMMIFGVGYHVIPRFAGAPLRSKRAAVVHWWMSNLGLAGLAAGFALRPHGVTAGTPVLVLGGVLSALGAYTFVVLIWRSIDAPARREVEKAMSAPSIDRVRVPLPLA
jgi:cbb3-type cytochrome oxidase subunit 1